ncbi:MAG: bifunctional enoyl-CoA hydratase/phosphate acetyltransferase [Pseudomonadota bacterium]
MRLESIPFDALQVGMEATETRLCRADDLYAFANTSGNYNPLHVPEYDGDGDGEDEAIAPGMWVSSLISSVLGNKLPGPGTLYKSQALTFLGHANAGESLTAGVRVKKKSDDRIVQFETWVEKRNGDRIVEGEATVIAPETVQVFNMDDMPGLTVRRHVHFDRLLKAAEPLDPLKTVVVAPEEKSALLGAVLAAEHTLIDPILIGDLGKVKSLALEHDLDISKFEIIDEAEHRMAAARAVAMVNDGGAKAIMKGHLHTDDLLAEVIKSDGGLRTGKRVSHVFVMDVPSLDHPLIITDAAINIMPDLKTKADIIQNAIYLAHALGIKEPRVAVLSAVETVNPAIPSTLDAALLSKMADRGQIKGGIVDGPLAMDNAVNIGAARAKGIRSSVAGQADILVAPNLDAGNMIAKQLTFLSYAEAGGLVLGCKCPIILTSRADKSKSRLASCALAVLAAEGAAA